MPIREQKRHRFTYLFIQINSALVKKNIWMRYFYAAAVNDNVPGRPNLMNSANPGPGALPGLLYRLQIWQNC